MIKIIDSKKMGKSDRGWLHSIFHFSFAEYYNPNNMNFGPLRVINDDIFDAQNGFATHPHENMEIISYVVDGVLTHKDSMGNKRELTRGQVQYMSAGTGVTHSEYNLTDNQLRFLQIWIMPDKNGYNPNYGDYQFDWKDRVGKWLHLVSNKEGSAPVQIHQDMNLYVVELDKGETIEYNLAKGRQAYLVQIEGTGKVNGLHMNEKDGAEIVDEEKIEIKTDTKAHYILFDMKAE
ncbi:MAG: pirin family protein [Anaerorhabdus sp.]|uniref:pirin family protein n=1 Tax=Anaerorhabdus sp. TaxID=1872524 RepID=UPI002FC5FEA2